MHSTKSFFADDCIDFECRHQLMSPISLYDFVDKILSPLSPAVGFFGKFKIWIFSWGRQGWASILSPFQNKPLIRKPRLHINTLNVLYTRNKPLKIMNIHEWIVLKSISRVKIQPNQNTVK